MAPLRSWPLIGALTACIVPPGLAADDWIDLTHTLSEDAVFWPTSAPLQMSTVAEGTTDGGYYYSAYAFCTAEHGGTHIDAPIHFAEGRRTVDQIPLEQLTGTAVVIDVTEQAAANRDYRVSVADLETFEKEHGAIPQRSIVLIRTGFSAFWPDARAYLGTGLRGPAGAAALSFPGLGEAAAGWLMERRAIKAVGIDTASIDYGKSTDFATHVRLMQSDVPVFENVANLEQLPVTGIYVVALPVKLLGGSGGPLRIIARRQ